MVRTSNAAHALMVASLLTAGCGNDYDAFVTGRVTLAGAPLTRGTVSFMPQSAGPPASGSIAADGIYELRTGRAESISSGPYIVTVTANEPPTQAQGEDGGPLPLGKAITPRWYADPATSGLAYTVKPGKNEINLDLSTTPPPGYKPPSPRR